MAVWLNGFGASIFENYRENLQGPFSEGVEYILAADMPAVLTTLSSGTIGSKTKLY